MHHAQIGQMCIHMRGYVCIYMCVCVYTYIGVCLPSYLLAVNSWHYFIIPPPLTSCSDDKGGYHRSAHGRPTW